MLTGYHYSILTALGLLVGTGFVHDAGARRANDPAALWAAGERLDRIPATIGAWTSVPGTLPTDALEMGGISHYVARTYTNARTGQAVTLTVLCGASGPISLHPPTACYQGNGYEAVGEPERVLISDDSTSGVGDEFLQAEFRSAGDGSGVRIVWGWSADGRWAAPESPRIHFAGEPALYKLYVGQDVRGPEADGGESAAVEFLRDTLPTLRTALAASPATTGDMP